MHKTSPKSELSGSSGQTLTTNVSMTLCDSQIRHQTHVLCGCTTFGTELKLGPKLIQEGGKFCTGNFSHEKISRRVYFAQWPEN